MNRRFLPWLDRSGKVSALKLAVLLALLAPALWIFGLWFTDNLGPKPVTTAIRGIGDWTIRILIVSLAVTPLRFASGWGRLILVRRMIGVSALAYVALHFMLYIVDQRFDLGHVALEIILRFYLTIGFIALTGLAVLGSTSTDAMIKRLGAPRWNRLHRLIFPIVVLAVIHDLLQARTEIGEACVLAGIVAILFGERILRARGVKASSAGYGYGLAALALLGVITTFTLEAAWLAARNHIDFWRVLAADFDFTYEIRPGWYVLALGLTLAALAALRNAGWGRGFIGGRAQVVGNRQ